MAIRKFYADVDIDGSLIVDEINCKTATQLVLNAGESAGQATGQTGELIYLNAESGLQINSSPDNWGSLWAGRNTVTICDTSGNSYFPGLLSTYNLTLLGLSGQGSENTSLMINGSGVVGTRELGSNAFTSTVYDNYNGWDLQVNTGTANRITSGENVDFKEGTMIDISLSGATVTVTHEDTSSQASVNNSGRTYIQDVTLDSRGHVTGLTSATETVTNTDTTNFNIQANSGPQTNISAGEEINFINGTATTAVVVSQTNPTVTFNHNDTSTLSGIYGSTADGTKIDQITVDSLGHVTAISTGATGVGSMSSFNVQANGGTQVAVTNAEEVNFINGNATTAVVTNQTNPTVTFNHNDTSSQGSINGSGRTYIQDITLDTYGHVTGLATATETVVNTNTNYYLTGLGYVSATSIVTATVSGAANPTLDLSNAIYADALAVSGNGTTSQYLRSDADGTFTWATPPNTDTNNYISALGYVSSTSILTATVSGPAGNVSIDLSNDIYADALAVSGNGTTSQYLRSDGDGTFSWVTPPNTNTNYYLSGITHNATNVTFTVNGTTDRTLNAATPSLAGVVSNTTQSFGGNKTFGGDVLVAGNILASGAGNNIDIRADGTGGYSFGFLEGDGLFSYFGGTVVAKFTVTNLGNGSFAGNSTAVDHVNQSDRRLKKDIKDYKVKKIDVKWREYKLKGTDEVQVGVIADELEEKHPEFVIKGETENDMDAVKYTRLLIAKVAELEDDKIKMESRLEYLENIINNLNL